MGVDSIRNVSGAQQAALPPSNGMFWSWSTGYIFLKAEGTSPQSANNSFMFHLGGFMNPNNIVTNKTTDFGSATLEIATDKKPSVLLKANPARLWHSASSVSVLSTIHMPGANAVQMATDFYSNIYFDKIQ